MSTRYTRDWVGGHASCVRYTWWPMNIYQQTARYVSTWGQKHTLRDDPFAHVATFKLACDGFDYELTAQSSPYAAQAMTYTLTVTQGENVVCEYHSGEDAPVVEVGTAWQKECDQ